MQQRNKLQQQNDVESVALGTLLVGMRKLYWDTEQFMRSRIEELEHRYKQLVGAASISARHELDEQQPIVKLGRPRKNPLPAPNPVMQAAGRKGWSTDPEERKREMRRRMDVRIAKQEEAKPPTHPRHPDHPDHKQWLAKTKRTRKKYWANLTVSQRKARLAAMQAGRGQKPNGHLGATA